MPIKGESSAIIGYIPMVDWHANALIWHCGENESVQKTSSFLWAVSCLDYVSLDLSALKK